MSRRCALAAVLCAAAWVAAGEMKWLEPEKAEKSNAGRCKPYLVLVAPKDDEFIAEMEKFLRDKKVRGALSGFVPVYVDSSTEEDNEALEKLKASEDDKYLLVCDFQWIEKERYDEAPEGEEVDEFLKALRRVRKANGKKKKVMSKIKKYYARARPLVEKKKYGEAGPYVRKIRELKEKFEKENEGEELRSPIFETIKEWAEEVRKESDRILSQMSRALESGNHAQAMGYLQQAKARCGGFSRELDEVFAQQEKIIKEEMERAGK